ncbi:unnamed protein product [Prunus brigantina]
MHQNVVLLDNGGGLIKAGLGGECDPSAVIPNCGMPAVAAALLAAPLSKCRITIILE